MDGDYGLFFLVLGIIFIIVGIIVFNLLKKKVRIRFNIGLGLITGGVVMLYIFVRVYVFGGTLE